METVKKYVIIGPESTGKSTLCRELAEQYHTSWVPEYAREYLEKNGMDYAYDDLLTIAKGQVELEDAISNQLSALNHQPEKLPVISNELSPGEAEYGTSQIVHRTSSGLIFIDTDMYVMKVWCEYVFNKCHNWILNRIAERNYDGYLLCNTDLPWVKDNLREYPDERNRVTLFHFYKDLLTYQQLPWVTISGGYEERFERAVAFIESTLNR